MKFNSLIPELTVSDINNTKDFYLEVLGFHLEYEREADKFIFISLEENQLMLEQYHEGGWNVAELEKPYGRGINFEMTVNNIYEFYSKVLSSKIPIYKAMQACTYREGEKEIVQHEFLVQDPDGYLLRFTD